MRLKLAEGYLAGERETVNLIKALAPDMSAYQSALDAVKVLNLPSLAEAAAAASCNVDLAAISAATQMFTASRELSLATSAMEQLQKSLHPASAIEQIMNTIGLERPASLAESAAQLGLSDRFRAPLLFESISAAANFKSPLDGALEAFRLKTSEVNQFLLEIQSGGLELKALHASLTSLVEMQGIARFSALPDPFNIYVTGTLRDYLGDWRKTIDWPQEIFDDARARTEFYIGLGFEKGLSDFPPNTFDEVVGKLGLLTGIPVPDGRLFRKYSRQPESKRANRAYNTLRYFEIHIRNFIEQELLRKHGTNWEKRALSEQFLTRWKERKSAAKEAVEPDQPLIAYADFTDYSQIIVKADNWRDVFSPYFRRKESVVESFQRLHPIRLCTMHSREITKEDELYMLVETKRLLSAIGIILEVEVIKQTLPND